MVCCLSYSRQPAAGPFSRCRLRCDTGGKERQVNDLPFCQDTATGTGADTRTVRCNASRGNKISSDVPRIVAGTALDTSTYLLGGSPLWQVQHGARPFSPCCQPSR